MKLARMSLMRRTMMNGCAQFSISHIQYPGPKSRSGDYRSKIEIKNSSFGEECVLRNGLDLLSKLGYYRYVICNGKHPTKATFKKMATDFILSSYDNGKV